MNKSKNSPVYPGNFFYDIISVNILFLLSWKKLFQNFDIYLFLLPLPSQKMGVY